MKEHFRVVEEMPFQTRASAPFSSGLRREREIHGRAGIVRIFRGGRSMGGAIRKSNAATAAFSPWQGRTDGKSFS